MTPDSARRTKWILARGIFTVALIAGALLLLLVLGWPGAILVGSLLMYGSVVAGICGAIHSWQEHPRTRASVGGFLINILLPLTMIMLVYGALSAPPD